VPFPSAGGTPRAAAFAQLLGELTRGHAQPREEAEKERAAECNRSSETGHTKVNANLRESRDVGWYNAHGCTHGQRSDQQPQGTTGRREHAALAHEPAQHMPAVRADRDAYGQLSLTTFRAHQQEVRHVRARDKENKPHGAEKNPERRARFSND
jgi:hypothetical protein